MLLKSGMRHEWKQRLALLALLTGAAGIGFAPIFVRLSEVGGTATAFYRIVLALPVLWLAAWIDQQASCKRKGREPVRELTPEVVIQNEPHISSPRMLFFAAGLFFAGDLAFWHWSIRTTNVANATLLTNFAPFFVFFGARLLFHEKITRPLVSGLSIAFVGGCMLVGSSLNFNAAYLFGDLLALITAFFYAGYLLSVKALRRSHSTWSVMALSGAISCLALFVISLLLDESLIPHTGKGWAVLALLAIVSHVGGQGLIAFALAHLPASFSSVGLLFQPVVAALLAWCWLDEKLQPLQAAGGAVVLCGIAVASRKR